MWIIRAIFRQRWERTPPKDEACFGPVNSAGSDGSVRQPWEWPTDFLPPALGLFMFTKAMPLGERLNP